MLAAAHTLDIADSGGHSFLRNPTFTMSTFLRVRGADGEALHYKQRKIAHEQREKLFDFLLQYNEFSIDQLERYCVEPINVAITD